MKKEEDKKEKKVKRKLKWQVKLFLFFLIIILYIFFIGPKGIFIKEYKISSSKINASMDGLKILQISDLHFGSTVNGNDVIKLTKQNLTS